MADRDPNEELQLAMTTLFAPPPMRLRDFFAAQILAAMPKETMTSLSGELQVQEADRLGWVQMYAHFCYEMADAMIEARKAVGHDATK